MTKIEWTERTWNPVRGCTRVSEGCRNCYAEIMAARFSGPGQWGEGLARMVKNADGSTDHRWTGLVDLADIEILRKPLHWKKPRLVFVNSTSDLFHENLPDHVIDRVFAVMAMTSRHTYQIVTKRPARAREYLNHPNRHEYILQAMYQLGAPYAYLSWPLENVWLLTSVEDQKTANERIPELLKCPAVIHGISAEPLLGALDLTDLVVEYPKGDEWHFNALHCDVDTEEDAPFFGRTIKWVIVGGESGPGARPMLKGWVDWIREQCEAHSVAFFFKQWGEWAPGENTEHVTGIRRNAHWFAGKWSYGETDMSDPEADWMDPPDAYRVGKKAAGRRLNGRIYDEYPHYKRAF